LRFLFKVINNCLLLNSKIFSKKPEIFKNIGFIENVGFYLRVSQKSFKKNLKSEEKENAGRQKSKRPH